MQSACALKVSARKSMPLTVFSGAWKDYSPPYLKGSWHLSLETLTGEQVFLGCLFVVSHEMLNRRLRLHNF
jgi:hypothetical protein